MARGAAGSEQPQFVGPHASQFVVVDLDDPESACLGEDACLRLDDLCDEHTAYRTERRVEVQPFNVAAVFTGKPGKYVSLADTVRSFGEILDGKHDEKDEGAFYMKGGIDEVTA